MNRHWMIKSQFSCATSFSCLVALGLIGCSAEDGATQARTGEDDGTTARGSEVTTCYDSGQLSPLGPGGFESFHINPAPQAPEGSVVQLTFEAHADLQTQNSGHPKHVLVWVNSLEMGAIYEDDGQHCADPPDVATIEVPAADWNAVIDGPVDGIMIVMIPTEDVQASCNNDGSHIRVLVDIPGENDEHAVLALNPNHGPSTGETPVQIFGRGFTPDSIVRFGTQLATDVDVVNESQINVVAPALGPGVVDVTVESSEACPPIALAPGAYEYEISATDDLTDSDGDGLTDVEEAAGREVWVDQFGLGLGTDTFGNITRTTVTSDPNLSDTDDDGLNDLEEFLHKSNPAVRDSDSDGLWDGEEVHRWHTSPISVDTDLDSRGTDGLAPPNAALFDGRELYTAEDLAKEPEGYSREPGEPRVLRLRATSPTLADTDGDAISDFEEFNTPSRSPVIADLPHLELEVVGDVDIRLDVEYSDG